MLPPRLLWFFNLLDLIELEKTLIAHMDSTARQAKAQEIIRNHVGFALGAGLAPFPGLDLLAVSGVQLNMLRQLAKLYQVNFLESFGRSLISAVAGGGAARLGASLIKIIPGVGTVVGEVTMPILAGASTYALGRVVANHFELGGTLNNLDFSAARIRYKENFEEGKQFVQESKQKPQVEEDFVEKLKKLSDLHKAGILTDAEFQEMKTRLLQQL